MSFKEVHYVCALIDCGSKELCTYIILYQGNFRGLMEKKFNLANVTIVKLRYKAGWTIVLLQVFILEE